MTTIRYRLREILQEYRKHRHVTASANGVLAYEQVALDAILALFAEGERDRERLDWLEAQQRDVFRMNGKWNLTARPGKRVYPTPQDDLRAALDAAKEDR